MLHIAMNAYINRNSGIIISKILSLFSLHDLLHLPCSMQDRAHDLQLVRRSLQGLSSMTYPTCWKLHDLGV